LLLIFEDNIACALFGDCAGLGNSGWFFSWLFVIMEMDKIVKALEALDYNMADGE
jgi:hypothetical protein